MASNQHRKDPTMFDRIRARSKKFGHAVLRELKVEPYKTHQQICELRLTEPAYPVGPPRRHRLLRTAR